MQIKMKLYIIWANLKCSYIADNPRHVISFSLICKFFASNILIRRLSMHANVIIAHNPKVLLVMTSLYLYNVKFILAILSTAFKFLKKNSIHTWTFKWVLGFDLNGKWGAFLYLFPPLIQNFISFYSHHINNKVIIYFL